MIAGPGDIEICNECVQLCAEILDEPRSEAPHPRPEEDASSKETPLSLEQAARDLEPFLDSQEQLVFEQQACERRYRKLLAGLIEQLEARVEPEGDSA